MTATQESLPLDVDHLELSHGLLTMEVLGVRVVLELEHETAGSAPHSELVQAPIHLSCAESATTFVETLATWLGHTPGEPNPSPPPLEGVHGMAIIEAWSPAPLRLGAKLFLEDTKRHAEVYFEVEDGRVRFSEKDEGHRGDLARLLAVGLRDGPRWRSGPRKMRAKPQRHQSGAQIDARALDRYLQAIFSK